MTDVLEQTPPEPARAPDGPRLGTPEVEASGWIDKVAGRLSSISIEGWITFVIVAGSVIFTLAQLHPNLLFSNTTPTGGDMGAHVWGPAYLRDHILPHWRLSGWAPDWYAGFPMYQFYMVIPALAVVLVNIVLPYGLALKLVSISGVLSLPIAVWAFGKLSGLRFPLPAMFSAMSVIFLFDESFTIYGGNIASTMAGEFSFSIALSLAFVYFGVLASGLRTGKHRALAAVLLALCVLCHLIVAIFAATGTVVWFLLYLDRRRFKWLATMVPVGALLTAFWVLPFFLRRHYLTDMGYERRTDYVNMLFPFTWKWDAVLFALGALGLIASVMKRRRTGVWLGLMTLIYGVWIIVWPQSMFWNARLTPFYYICRYLLAAIGAAEIGFWIASTCASAFTPRAKRFVTILTPVIGAAICIVILGMSLRILPGGRMVQKQTSSGSVAAYSWLGLTSTHAAFVDDWAKWNYSGYEGKPAYGEYRGVMETMQNIGDTRGCGRAEWEYDAQLNQYGTPMAMMLLPFWTDGCIDSMEGLFFESSATTPYHFLASSALSAAPSRPVRNLRYDPLDVEKGTKYMQLLGVKYYMAFSPAAVKEARQQKDLTEIATSGPWVIFEVADSDIVTPLTNQPVVVKGADKDAKSWLHMSEDFFLDPKQWNVELAASGPKDWARIETGQTPPETAVPPVAVSNITAGDDRISFDVDKVGVPVLVKASYFPNWQASGAQGPWRVAPNLMVVIPTSKHVSLHYGRTPVDLIAMFLTLLGIAGVVWLARRPPLVFPVPAPQPDEPVDATNTRPVEWDTWEEWDGSDGWEPDTPAEEEWSYEPQSAAPEPADSAFGKGAYWVDDETAPWRASGMRDPRNR